MLKNIEQLLFPIEESIVSWPRIANLEWVYAEVKKSFVNNEPSQTLSIIKGETYFRLKRLKK